MQPHVSQELKNIDFDLLKLQQFMDYGVETHTHRHQIYDLVFADPDMRKRPEYYSWSREDKIKHNVRMQYKFVKEIMPKLPFKMEITDINEAMMCLQGLSPSAVHIYMFYITVKSLASEEQVRYWLPMIRKL